MGHGPAPILEPYDVPTFLEMVELGSRNPVVDGVTCKLSFRGGLRVNEIAHLTLDAVLDPRGRLRDEIRITITKGRNPRTIFMHPEIREAIERFMWEYPGLEWFAASPRDGRQMTPAALSMHFKRLYDDLGFIGCTSHTGRASCLTELARRANEFDCSLWDVKEFAGHKHLSSTAKYLRASDRGRDLVHALGSTPHHHSTNRGRETNDFAKRNDRYANPAHVLRHRQHEAWVAGQFLRSRVQPQWRAERDRGTARRY